MSRLNCRKLCLQMFHILLLAALGIVVTLVVTLLAWQRRLVFFPDSYQPLDEQEARRSLQIVEYETSEGAQAAFYVRPRLGDRPEWLWVVHGGNASRALDWRSFVEDFPDSHTAFLLIDYPGYGLNEGKPSRRAIIEASQAALQRTRETVLAADDGSTSTVHLGLLGHSIGAAATLDLAVCCDAERVVLIAPFTSLMAMARRTVGWPLCLLLLDRFDNARRLEELATRADRPAMTIFHGTADEIIPYHMGRSLADAHRDWVRFYSVPDGHHGWIIESARPAIHEAMMGEKHVFSLR